MRAPAVAKYTDFGQLWLRNPAPPAQANSKFFSSKLGEKFTTNLEFQEKFNKGHILLKDTVGQRSFPKPVLGVGIRPLLQQHARHLQAGIRTLRVQAQMVQRSEALNKARGKYRLRAREARQ